MRWSDCELLLLLFLEWLGDWPEIAHLLADLFLHAAESEALGSRLGVAFLVEYSVLLLFLGGGGHSSLTLPATGLMPRVSFSEELGCGFLRSCVSTCVVRSFQWEQERLGIYSESVLETSPFCEYGNLRLAEGSALWERPRIEGACTRGALTRA